MFPFTANHTFTFTPRFFQSVGDIPAAAAAQVRSQRILHVPCSEQPRHFDIELEPLASLQPERHDAVVEKPGHLPRESEAHLRPLFAKGKREMKFSHSIQFNAVPDWSSHYIAYSNLKKL